MRHWIIVALVAIIAAAVGAGIAFLVANKTRVEVAVGEMRGELLSLNPPPGTLTREQNTAYKGAAAPAPVTRDGARRRSKDAAAPRQSLEFFFWGGGLVVFPVVLIYTAAVFWIFRGKVRKVAQEYGA